MSLYFASYPPAVTKPKKKKGEKKKAVRPVGVDSSITFL